MSKETLTQAKIIIRTAEHYCRTGKKLQAVKYVRNNTDMGLVDSKQFVDDLFDSINIT